jgi:uncharacterized RDD family membrane protein YckC
VIVNQPVSGEVLPAERVPRIGYVGLVTRAIAFVIDAAVINIVAIVVSASLTLALTVLTLPDALETTAIALGGVIYLCWCVGYFVTFWTTTGQTPGGRTLGLRVTGVAGGAIRPSRAILRFFAMLLAAIPLFAGFLPILVDNRRRGIHDMIAGTVVLEAESRAEARVAARRGRAVR